MKNLFKSSAAFTIFAVVIGTSSPSAQADTAIQIATSECKTAPTDFKGRRKHCDGAWAKVVAPEGYVINREKVVVRQGGNGKNHGCRVRYSDLRAINGGDIVMPGTVEIQSYADSRPAKQGDTGASKCVGEVHMSKI